MYVEIASSKAHVNFPQRVSRRPPAAAEDRRWKPPLQCHKTGEGIHRPQAGEAICFSESGLSSPLGGKKEGKLIKLRSGCIDGKHENKLQGLAPRGRVIFH